MSMESRRISKTRMLTHLGRAINNGQRIGINKEDVRKLRDRSQGHVLPRANAPLVVDKVDTVDIHNKLRP